MYPRMRRIFAITLIASLIFSVASPAWATACAAMNKTPMCHRTAAHHHHCEMMMEQEHETATPDSEAAMHSLPGKCPMNCCTQSQAGNSVAAPVISLLPQLAVAEYHTVLTTVVFTRSGFSSHTDRGPPLT